MPSVFVWFFIGKLSDCSTDVPDLESWLEFERWPEGSKKVTLHWLRWLLPTDIGS